MTQWYKVEDQAKNLVTVTEITYSDVTTWQAPGYSYPVASESYPILEVVVGSTSNDGEWLARERVECLQYAFIEGTLYVNPKCRPLLSIWTGAANPVKKRDSK